MNVTIIGIDCATVATRVGLALGVLRDSEAEVVDVMVGARDAPLAQTIAAWIPDDAPTLLVLDAPLGWPEPLGTALKSHSAGDPLKASANALFRRRTDEVVHRMLGRLPLEVGADRIARTARAALALLDALRTLTGTAIPLAWHPEVAGVSAIEIYPAATLTSYGLRASGYKRPGDAPRRAEIIAALRAHLALPLDVTLMASNADALDAVLCVLAAADFLRGRCLQPKDLVLAQKEGWIWFHPRA